MDNELLYAKIEAPKGKRPLAYRRSRRSLTSGLLVNPVPGLKSSRRQTAVLESVSLCFSVRYSIETFAIRLGPLRC